MSGQKYAAPDYHSLYQQELSSRQRLERENRELSRRNRENEVVAQQIQRSEANLRREVQAVQDAAQQNAHELVRVHETQQRALNEIAGVRVQLNVTQENLQTLRWETQAQHAEQLDIQRQVRQQVEQNRAEIMRNRIELQRGFEQVTAQFEQVGQQVEGVQKQIASIERRERIEQMRTAAQMLETTLLMRFSIPEDVLNRFDPEGFRSAHQLFQLTQEKFEAGDYQAAIEIGSNTVTAMTNAVTHAEREHNVFLRKRQDAIDAYNDLEKSLVGVNNDATRLWFPDKLDALLAEARQLDELIATEDFESLRVQSRELDDQVQALQSEVDHSADRHTARITLAQSFVEAMAASGPSIPQTIDFVDINDPNSDVIIETDGPAIYLPLQGDLRFKFPTENSVQNMEWMQQFNQTSQQQQIARLNIRG